MTTDSRDREDEVTAWLPPELLERVRRGFQLLGRVEPDRRRKLFQFVVQSGGHSRYGQSTSDAADLLEMSPEDAADVMAGVSAMFHVGIRGGRGSAVEFVTRVTKSGAVPGEAANPAQEFAKEIDADKSAHRAAHDRLTLADRVLPSLEYFSGAVDVRLGFRKGSLDSYVPVLVACVSTDASEGGLIWFQATRDQVDRLMTELARFRDEMDQAEGAMKKVTGK